MVVISSVGSNTMEIPLSAPEKPKKKEDKEKRKKKKGIADGNTIQKKGKR